MRGWRIGLQQAGQKESGRRDALRAVDAAASTAQQKKAPGYCQPRDFPV
jgi:hypothetical protein